MVIFSGIENKILPVTAVRGIWVAFFKWSAVAFSQTACKEPRSTAASVTLDLSAIIEEAQNQWYQRKRSPSLWGHSATSATRPGSGRFRLKFSSRAFKRACSCIKTAETAMQYVWRWKDSMCARPSVRHKRLSVASRSRRWFDEAGRIEHSVLFLHSCHSLRVTKSRQDCWYVPRSVWESGYRQSWTGVRGRILSNSCSPSGCEWTPCSWNFPRQRDHCSATRTHSSFIRTIPVVFRAALCYRTSIYGEKHHAQECHCQHRRHGRR